MKREKDNQLSDDSSAALDDFLTGSTFHASEDEMEGGFLGGRRKADPHIDSSGCHIGDNRTRDEVKKQKVIVNNLLLQRAKFIYQVEIVHTNSNQWLPVMLFPYYRRSAVWYGTKIFFPPTTSCWVCCIVVVQQWVVESEQRIARCTV